jgi:hypothetical protein
LPRANKAEDEGREEEMSQAIKAAENLSRNAGLD